MPDGDTRNFSMANPPHESDGAQLHIRHVPGGRFRFRSEAWSRAAVRPVLSYR